MASEYGYGYTASLEDRIEPFFNNADACDHVLRPFHFNANIHGPSPLANGLINSWNVITFNTGDRIWSGYDSPQDQERIAEMLRPVQHYVANARSGSEYTLAALDHGQHQLFDESPATTNFAPLTFHNDMPVPQLVMPPDAPAIDPQLLSSPHLSIASMPRDLPAVKAAKKGLWCFDCNDFTACSTDENLKRHQERKHGNAIEYPCHYYECLYSSTKPTDVTRHINSKHLKLHDYSCPSCGKTFTRKDNRDRHARRCSMKNVTV